MYCGMARLLAVRAGAGRRPHPDDARHRLRSTLAPQIFRREALDGLAARRLHPRVRRWGGGGPRGGGGAMGAGGGAVSRRKRSTAATTAAASSGDAEVPTIWRRGRRLGTAWMMPAPG